MTARRVAARIFVGTVRFLLTVLILGGAVWGARTLIASRPEVPKVEREASATFVEVMTAQASNEPVLITTFGTVQAHRTLTVQPEVGGRVVAHHPQLIIGGVLRQGSRILRIDPRDYQFAVDGEQAAVAKADLALQIEQGNQVVAQREWALLGDSVKNHALSQQLALRQPHLKEKQVALEAARSRLEKAQVDLQRAILTAPFNALVLKESVEVGQLITPPSPVATLVGTDEFRVQVSLPVPQLDWIELPGPGRRQGAKARIIRDLGNGASAVREGFVVRRLGEVTANGRLAQLHVAVQDPLALDKTQGARAPLLLGEYVQVDIQGPLLPGVFALPRGSVRENSQVWIKNRDNQLDIRQVEIVLYREHTVLIRSGLHNGDQVITSSLSVAIPGMLLESQDDAAPRVPPDSGVISAVPAKEKE